MRIMGIDPGLAHTGYGVIEFTGSESRMLVMGEIVTRADAALALRLQEIHDRLHAVIEAWQPEAVAVESLFFCTNVRTAIAVAQARGVALLATATANVPLFEYTPLEIKLAVSGYGKATKEQMQKMVRAILGLREEPRTSHAADALAAALCHAHSQRFQQFVEWSQSSRRR
ncbi:MAG: crossover junction endodeoxyribonuclease RuvC [Candidatus Sumerlaeaceae bacterium]|jgi:crossover junction endodeoxyribonuclease RuvC